MNTYKVYPKNVLDAEPLGTITAIDIDEARARADVLYGVDTDLVREYSTNTMSLDPLWILLGILIVARLAKGKLH